MYKLNAIKLDGLQQQGQQRQQQSIHIIRVGRVKRERKQHINNSGNIECNNKGLTRKTDVFEEGRNNWKRVARAQIGINETRSDKNV